MSKPVAWLAYAMDASESRVLCQSLAEAEALCEQFGWALLPLVPLETPSVLDEQATAELLAYSSLPIDDNYRCTFRLERRNGKQFPPNELVRGFLKSTDAFVESMREELVFQRKKAE